MRMLILLISMIALGGCAVFDFRSPYEKAIDIYPDKPDLVLDRKANAEFVRARPGEWHIQFEPVDIAASESDKAKRLQFNRLIQENTSNLCKAMQKNSYVPLQGDSEVQADIESYLKQLPTELRSQALSRGRSIEGETLLMCVVKSNRSNVVEYLVHEKKVDISPTNYHGEDAKRLAQNADIGVQEIFARSGTRGQGTDAVHKRYCQGNHVKRNMVEQLTVVLPVNPKGIPLDKAQSTQAQLRDKARRFAKELFVIERQHMARERRLAGLEKAEAMLPPSQANEMFGFGQVKYQSHGKSVTPVLSDLASWVDLDALRYAYSFNFPKEFQESSFIVENVGDPYTVQFDCNGGERSHGRFTDDGGYLGLNENCEFSPGQAMADRKRAWFNVAHKFTTVKESPGASPNEIKFEVTLNMEPFCKYGVSISDLKSN